MPSKAIEGLPRFYLLLATTTITLGFGCHENVAHKATPEMSITDAGSMPQVGDGGHDVMPFDAQMPDAMTCFSEPQLDTHGVRIACGLSELLFDFEINVDGQWRTPTTCESDGSASLECAFPSGTAILTIEGHTLTPQFIADRALSFDGFRLRGEGGLAQLNGWLSNGFQSTSQSGVLTVGPPKTEVQTRTALELRGDLESVRQGSELSWWTTYTVSKETLITGATQAFTFPTWIQISKAGDQTLCTVTNGGLDDAIALKANQSVVGDALFIGLFEDRADALQYYASHLPKRRDSAATPEIGWNSWYAFWFNVSEEAVLDNAARLNDIFQPYLGELSPHFRIIIENGWQRDWGDWSGHEGFPNGIASTASQLLDGGFRPGIWIAPLLYSPTHPTVIANPDWFLSDAVFDHVRDGALKILDVSHPEGERLLRTSIQDVVSAGFDLLKLDFMVAGSYASRRFETMTRLQAYNRALRVVREAAGESTILTLLGSPPIAGFEFIDTWKVGPDVAMELFGPSWYFLAGKLRADSARWFYCIYTLCDNDPSLLRTLPDNEVRLGAWGTALMGGGFMVSDDLRILEMPDSGILESAIIEQALSGIPARPNWARPITLPQELNSQLNDHVSQISSHVSPPLWALPDSTFLLFNTSDMPLVYGSADVDARSVIRSFEAFPD